MTSTQSISVSPFPPGRRSGWPRCRLGPALRSTSSSRLEATLTGQPHFSYATIAVQTPSAPRYGLPFVGCLKQMPNAIFQQFDSALQGAELSNPHYRDGHVQFKGWGAQHLNRVERFVQSDKARRQQPESISRLNERQLKMHVVDF